MQYNYLFLVLSIKICIHFKKTLNHKSKLVSLFFQSFLLIYWIHILFVFKLITFSLKIISLRTQADERATTTAKKLNLFLRKIWQHSFYDIFHMCTDVCKKILKKFLTSSQQMCKTQTGEHLLCRFLLLFSPHVPSSPSFFVLRMVLNECTYTHPHVPSLFLMLQFASSNER